MPIDLLPPHAYVVDVRPLDHCVVPQCAIKGRDVTGYQSALELDGDFGGYASYGKGANEMFFRRSVVLRGHERFVFDIPESEAPSELDFYLSAPKEGPFAARIVVTAQSGPAPSVTVLDHRVGGDTQPWVNRTKDEQVTHVGEFLQHHRTPLPSRKERILHVVVENALGTPLALGNPLVMKRVEGRGPRQGFVVIYDAVPFYVLDKLFTGTGDAPTQIWSERTKTNGIFFPDGFSPGFATQFFVRRFFRSGYYQQEGEPMLRGSGAGEEPPAVVPTPIARFAEQGFLTEQFAGNLLLTPDATVTGVDGGYQNEMTNVGKWPTLYHPRHLAQRFDAWLDEHPRDDTWAVIWMSTTHDAARLPIWNAKRPFIAAPMPPTVTREKDYSQERVQARWENLLDAAEQTERIFQSAARHSPDASRLWFVATDHGLVQTHANHDRAARYRGSIVYGGPEHRFFGATEETWTPFALLYDGVARAPGGPRVVHGATMAAASWRAFEQLFGVSLGLPDTTSWDSPALSPDFGSRWHDEGSFSVGHASAVRVASGTWGYRGHRPKLWMTPIWDENVRYQELLGGGDRRSNSFFHEELYDDEHDPLETKNIAAEHPAIVLAMRRQAQDLVTTYQDAPSHPRHRHVLTFASPIDLVIEGPRAFKVRADDIDVVMPDPRRVSVKAKRIEIIEDKEAMGLVSIESAQIVAPLLLRCAASGQPLDELTPARSRFDLAVARHNCVTKSEASPPEGEVYFWSELVRTVTPGATAVSAAGGPSDQTLEAMKRWGYVRDLEKKP